MRRLLALVLVLAAATAANAATINEKIDRTFEAKAGSELNLSNVNGSVTIKAWDQPRVRIVAEKQTRAGDADAARDAMKRLKVEMTQQGNSINVETKHPRKGDWGFLDFFMGQNVEVEVTYEVWVPRNLNMEIENVNGAVLASDVNGKLELATVNGKIDVTRCGGSLEAATVNGGIRAELLNVTKGAPVRLATTNGRITLYVPSTLAATLDADTTNGSIDSDLPVAVTRKSRNTLRGTINGGGPELDLSTTNGSIEVKTTTGMASK